MAQILPYEDIELEKLYILLKKLISKILPPKGEDLSKGILDNVDFDSYRVQLDKTEDILLSANGGLNPSNADETSKTPESELEDLLNIVKEFNEKFGNIEWTSDDKLIRMFKNIKDDVAKDDQILSSFNHSDMQNFRIDFEKVLKEKIQNIIYVNFDFYKKINDDNDFKERITQKMFDVVLLTLEAK